MPKQQKLIVGFSAVALFGFIIYSAVQQGARTYEVCVSYKGRSHCATAAARTQAEAVSTGQQMSCALITDGRDENIACLAAPPSSVKEVTK